MNTDSYRALLHLAQSGNLTRTAQALGYTQSGMSHVLKNLEDAIGLRLMLRTQKGVCLTAEGKALLPYFQAVCTGEDALIAKAASLKGLHSGCLRIGSFLSATSCLLPPTLERFRSRYPGIQVQLRHGEYREIESWILSGRADCGFITLPANERLTVHLLLTDSFVSVLPPGHPLCANETVTGEELCHYPLIRYEEGMDTEMRHVLDRLGLEEQSALCVPDDCAILSLVERGLGVSVLPRLLLHAGKYSVESRPLSPPISRRIAFAYAGNPAPSPLLEQFTQVVLQHSPANQGR